MARTPKTDNPRKLSGRFWKLLGASTDKNQARSMDEVSGAAEFDDKAAELDDEQLRKAAQLLNLDDLADSADIPQFLAIAREAAEQRDRPASVRRPAAGRAADARRRRRRDGDR